MTKEDYVETWGPRRSLNETGQRMGVQVLAEALSIMLSNEDCNCVELNCLPSWCASCEDLRRSG